jgi:4-diphosphocytidyl-2-C-methyl-D-erythritol kinase
MIVFPNCKINLGLHIVSKREDGYHNLETIFYPVPLKDSLELILDSSSLKPRITFTQSGLEVKGDTNNNICVKAYQLLVEDFPNLPAVTVHLHKSIPMGAGLGGGSSDAGYMLQLLNEKFNLSISNEKLMQYALKLGSDCPFFIYNKPCLAKGRGEKLIPISLDLKGYQLVLINPGIHISTAEAFSGITPKEPVNSLEDLSKKQIIEWKEFLINDFEESVFKAYPEIEEIKNKLYGIGAIYSSMSGTGSSVYGIFPKSADVNLDFPDNYYVKIISL